MKTIDNLIFIDLEKESEEFIKYIQKYTVNMISFGRVEKKRAELVQAEINELKKEEIKYKEKYGKLIGKIHELENKLGRYESDDYVLVPRNPEISLIDLIDSLLCFPDVTTLEAYKAIIEAVENTDVH